MKTHDLSIIIVTFNNQEIIGQCLASLKQHIHMDVELFLIDNNSSDNTRHMLTDFDAFTTHKIFNSENLGYTRAVNQGLSQAMGKYVLMLNPDVVLTNDVFPALCAHLQGNTAVVAPQLRYPDNRIQASCRRFPKKRDVLFEALALTMLFKQHDFFNSWRMPSFDHNSSRFVDQPQGAFLLTTQTALQQIGLLDEQFFMFFSDVEWCKRVYSLGMQIYFCADQFVYHVHGASVRKHRVKMILTSHKSFIQYFRKYDRTVGQKIATCGVLLLLSLGTIPRILMAAVSKK